METNLLDDDGRLEPTWRPERRGYLWRRKRVAGEHLGAGLIELTPGESTFLDHYELGTVERVVVRRPPDAGRRTASATSWPATASSSRAAPRGHKVTNRSTDGACPPRLELRAPPGRGSGGQRQTHAALGSGPDERRWSYVGEDADYWDGDADV